MDFSWREGTGGTLNVCNVRVSSMFYFGRSLDSANRDRFSQKLTVFRMEVRLFIRF